MVIVWQTSLQHSAMQDQLLNQCPLSCRLKPISTLETWKTTIVDPDGQDHRHRAKSSELAYRRMAMATVNFHGRSI
jgi:hypothetical protein